MEIVEEVGADNAFIFGLSSDEVINYEQNGGYDSRQIYNSDPELKRVVDQLVDGTYAQGDTEMYRDLYNSLLMPQGNNQADVYFHPERFPLLCRGTGESRGSFTEIKDRWAKMVLLNTASCGKFSSDRTIQEYVDDIWKLDKETIFRRNLRIKFANKFCE